MTTLSNVIHSPVVFALLQFIALLSSFIIFIRCAKEAEAAQLSLNKIKYDLTTDGKKKLLTYTQQTKLFDTKCMIFSVFKLHENILLFFLATIIPLQILILSYCIEFFCLQCIYTYELHIHSSSSYVAFPLSLDCSFDV